LENSNLPKIIWFLWLQGMDAAPLVVKKCYASWQKHNPDWKLIFLDQQTIGQYYTLKPLPVTKQALSDILRINLLEQYGGVWVDATCFCNKPLNNWLYNHMQTGFFAFNRPGPDRMISSWFLASAKGNYITRVYQQAVNRYWDDHTRLDAFENSKWHFLYKFLNRKPAQFWFNGFITRVLKIYPYFWFHYLFEYLYKSDAEFRKIWDDTIKISADIPHKIQLEGMFSKISRELKQEIDLKLSPVYKITWKYDKSEYIKGSVLDYLLAD
jgi:hypothetical protein